MKRTTRTLGIAAAAITALAAPGLAATATGNLAVSANVIDTCDVSSTPLLFGNLNTTAITNESAKGVITVTCTASNDITVKLGGGQNAAGAQRQMKEASSTNYVPYLVYSDSGHGSAVAIDGTIFDGSVGATVPQPIDVFGQVPLGSYSFGSYTDTVTITVTYGL